MLEARALLDWHLKKGELLNLEKELQDLRKREETLSDKRIELKRNIQAIGEPKEEDIDRKIALALAAQELWLIEKEWEKFLDERFNQEIFLKEQMEVYQEEIEEMEREISSDGRRLYDEISEVCDPPIVEVRRRSCMGCFLPLSMPTLNEWRKGKKLVRCEVCGRILV